MSSSSDTTDRRSSSRTAETNNIYKARVGTVINNEDNRTIVSNQINLPTISTPESEQIDSALSILDRIPQRNVVIPKVKALLRDSARRAVLIVLPGWIGDAPTSFARRCAKVEFPNISNVRSDDAPHPRGGAGGAPPIIWNAVDCAPWRYSRNAEDIFGALCQQFGLPETEDHKKCLTFVAERQINLFFSHSIGWEVWSRSQERLVREWIEFVSRRWPRMDGGRIAVGMLCLDLGTRRNLRNPIGSYRMWELSRFVSSLAREYAHDTSAAVVVAPRLNLIEPDDIREWARLAGNYLKRDDLPNSIDTAIPGLFPHPGTGIDFVSAYEGLRKPLTYHLFPSFRFYGRPT